MNLGGQREETVSRQPSWFSVSHLCVSRECLLGLETKLQQQVGWDSQEMWAGEKEGHSWCSFSESGTRLENWILGEEDLVKVFSWLTSFPGLFSWCDLNEHRLVLEAGAVE